MLGQIETAKSVPTVTVIWRIADALGIAISALISTPEPEPAAVVRALDRTNAVGAIHPLWPADHGDEPRLFEIRLLPGQSAPHASQAMPQRASLVVAKGRIRVEFETRHAIDLDEGDAAFYDAQQPALIVNGGCDVALAYLALSLKRTA